VLSRSQPRQLDEDIMVVPSMVGAGGVDLKPRGRGGKGPKGSATAVTLTRSRRAVREKTGGKGPSSVAEDGLGAMDSPEATTSPRLSLSPSSPTFVVSQTEMQQQQGLPSYSSSGHPRHPPHELASLFPAPPLANSSFINGAGAPQPMPQLSKTIFDLVTDFSQPQMNPPATNPPQPETHPPVTPAAASSSSSLPPVPSHPSPVVSTPTS